MFFSHFFQNENAIFCHFGAQFWPNFGPKNAKNAVFKQIAAKYSFGP
jgi:hypothetical protein